MGKKEKRCRSDVPEDRRCGDNWDHVAFDPEHKLVVSVVPGKRTRANVRGLVEDFHRRTRGRVMRLITSDEYKPYREAVLETYGETYPRRRRGTRGRHPKPGRRAPQGLLYAVVRKHRRKGRVVRVTTNLVYGTQSALDRALATSPVSRSPNIAFVERYNATDRQQNGRKARKSYRFSKDRDIHNAATFFTMYNYNFCWPVRTLRRRRPDGSWGPPRTPAMAAGLADHAWTLTEWLTYPAVNRSST